MDDQTVAINWLMDPATHDGTSPEHIETHGAHVILAGDTAYKIKRAVAYDYMDFSTLDLRRQMLDRELQLNKPAAPNIYKDVVPVCRDDTGLHFGPGGELVEWVLRMRRFARDQELSYVVDQGGLTDGLAEELGQSVAGYHAQAPKISADGSVLIGDILEELDQVFSGMTDSLGVRRITRFSQRAWAVLSAVTPLLKDRSDAGFVRRCHGDLHLRNLVLIDGRPTPFDALEFDEVLGTCDILYDLAFLIMDLQHRGLDRAATLVLDAWLYEANGAQDAGLAALPLFLAVRAAIRAMVCVQTGQAAHHEAEENTQARAYLEQALAALEPVTPRLVVVAGASGTGKTTLSRRLAPDFAAAPGAIHLRSDLERKALAGVDPLTRLPASSYSSEASQAVYDRLFKRAETLIKAGYPVVIDATFWAQAEREAVEQLARRLNVPFTGLWLVGAQDVLEDRVNARQGDASDADASVVQLQMAKGAGQVDWTHLDISQPVPEVDAQAHKALGL